MKTAVQDEILKEGMDVLYQKMGAVKATRFLQMVSLAKGDILAEIEQITEQMTKSEVLEMINHAQKSNKELWKKAGLF